MNKKDRAKDYFLLAEKYSRSSELLLNYIIANNNCLTGIGATDDEAIDEALNNYIKSDAALLIPAIFDMYQSLELFAKGLLLLNGNEIDNNHNVDDMIIEIKKIYSGNKKLIDTLTDLYGKQIDILKQFKRDNNITNVKELYESLRYPENNKAQKKHYNYYSLMNNFENGNEQYEEIINLIKDVREGALCEFLKK